MKQTFGRVIPSIAFVHIPVHATWSFQQKITVDPNNEPGINDEAVGHQGTECDPNNQNCHYAALDVPFMRTLVETDGLIAAFSGHDHGLDWCMKWSATEPLPENEPPTGNGIFLCFGRHTGYGGYGNWMRGARQIVLHEKDLKRNELETWIRLENGNVSGPVTLNETYGSDKYPAVSKILSEDEENEESDGKKRKEGIDR